MTENHSTDLILNPFYRLVSKVNSKIFTLQISFNDLSQTRILQMI